MSETDAVALLLALGWREQQRPMLVVDDGLTTHQMRRVLIAPTGAV